MKQMLLTYTHDHFSPIKKAIQGHKMYKLPRWLSFPCEYLSTETMLTCFSNYEKYCSTKRGFFGII